MKKIVSCLLSLVTIATMITPAFAVSRPERPDPIKVVVDATGEHLIVSPAANTVPTSSLMLHPAQKISWMLELLHPAQYADENISRLRRYNDPEILKESQDLKDKSVWGLLSDEGRSAISGKTTSGAISVIRNLPEYTEIPELELLLDRHAQQVGSSAAEVRATFSAIWPQNGYHYDSVSVDQLMLFAKEWECKPEYLDLVVWLARYNGMSHDAYTLSQYIEYDELEQQWARLYDVLAALRSPLVDFMAMLDRTDYLAVTDRPSE